ncbi:lipid II:glycine glycyltransferase FemX [Dictyobacter formicarum]|uniref:Methicillin resistance protein n=1 Tax=Dictyobacter formicarum TaxID=2778368 RepID=A0ABQ3VL26_9CHLR|nr:peptidoglycan bridge formation glycyltransferase FemA/FemB family protein [Dictyobacter formicarum]GHO86602.1 methicillin resistance protein [Dictyobacter formicarum]
MSITIQEIHDREQWNTFVLSQPHGHFLQSYEWGELSRELGEQIYRLGVLEDGRLIGTMLLTVSAVPLPLPKLRPTWLYCARGPVLEHLDVSILALLVKHVATIAQHEHAVVLRVEPNIADDDPNLDTWLAVYHKAGFLSNPNSVHGRRSWVLDIRPPAEKLYSRFIPAWQSYIRSAEQQGVVVRTACLTRDFDTYYELIKASSERSDVFVHAKDYHWQTMQTFATSNDATILLAEQNGRLLAAKMILRFGHWCWDMFTGELETESARLAAYLLQYHALQWAQKRGCHFFDFRSIPDVLVPGEDLWEVYEYKRGFGGYSRLTMPTQDYVYQPLIYKPWRKLVELGRQQRHKERQHAEPEQQFLSGIPEVLSDAD